MKSPQYGDHYRGSSFGVIGSAPICSALATVQKNWSWFLAGGIALIVLGIFAVGAAALTSFVTVFFLGTVLFISGVAQLIYSFWAREWSGFFVSLLLGIFYGVIGALFLARPLSALAALTLLIGALFVVSGLFKIFVSLAARFEHWGWVLFSGMISLVLGSMILADWPMASLWVIGLFVGIDLMIYGWTWVVLSLAARRLK